MVASATLAAVSQERIGHQWSRVGTWLTSSAAAGAAEALCRRRGLPIDLAPDLVNDAWVKLDAVFKSRSEPYPDLDDDVAAERFARRVLANLAIDRARSLAQRSVVPMSGSPVFESSEPSRWSGTVESLSTVENNDAVFHLRRSVGSRIADTVDPCPGCPGNVVAAVALFVCNSLACGQVPSESGNPLDNLIYEGLRSHDPAHFGEMRGRPNDAQRKRKSRCGSCVVTLLRECAESLGLGVA